MKKIFGLIAIGAIIIFIILSVAGIVVAFLISNFDHNISDVLTTIFLYLTFLAVIWYSWETMQLKIETRRLRKWAASDNSILKKQNITSIRPYLRLQTIDGVDDKLRLVNEGKGVAVNLQIKYKKSKKEVAQYAVTAMASAPSSFTDIYRNGVSLDSQEGYSIEIRYKDIEDRKYIVIFKPNVLFNDRFEILKQVAEKVET